jgi:hypothetical protein
LCRLGHVSFPCVSGCGVRRCFGLCEFGGYHSG